MFFNVPNNVHTWDFASAGCGSRSLAAHLVRALLRREPGAGRVENSTIDTVKDDRARKVRRTYRATDAGMWLIAFVAVGPLLAALFIAARPDSPLISA